MTLDLGATLFETMREVACRCPEAPACTFLDAALTPTRYTYRRLFDAADDLARRVAGVALPPRSPVGILVASQESQVLHYLALLSAGLVPALLTPPNRKLDRRYYLETTRAILAQCHFSAVISDLEELAPPSTVLLCPHTLRPRHGRPPRTHLAVDGALLQYSSGTTGLKRGVVVSDRAALSQIAAYSRAIELSRADRVVSWLPLYHDMGFMACLNMPLACGVEVVMLHPLDWVARPAGFLRAVSRHAGTLAWHPNFAFAFMASRVDERDVGDCDLSSLRGLVNCSEPVTAASQDRFLARFAGRGLRDDVFWGCYAMAETTFAVTHGRSSDAGYVDRVGPVVVSGAGAPAAVSVGRPLDGTELSIVSEQGAALPDRQVGELRVRAPFLATEYFADPIATREAFRDGWYSTGDLGYRAGNEFFVCGRRKDLIIVGGVNIHPQDLEALVAAVPGILDGRVAAFGVVDEESQTERAVIVAETRVAESERSALWLDTRRRVAAALQMTGFDVLLVAPGSLIKSSSGKMARNANREKFGRPLR